LSISSVEVRENLSCHVQTRTYRITLKNMGFDVSKPKFYAIVVVDRRTKDDDQFKVRVVDSTLKNGLQEAVLTTENAVIHLTFALGKQNLYLKI